MMSSWVQDSAWATGQILSDYPGQVFGLVVWSDDLLKTSFISYCRRWDMRLGGSAMAGCLMHSCSHYSAVTPTKANEEASLVFSKELDQCTI